MNVTDKVALITGGGTGVGRATALQLAAAGCHVAVNYSRSREEAEHTVKDVAALGPQATAIQADVSCDDQVRTLVEKTVERFGRLDVLVNCAGATEFIAAQDLDAATDEVWEKILSVNLIGPFRVARAASKVMLAGDGGEIVNVSSIAALSGAGSSIPYACSKGGLNTLTLSLARTLAPTIRVNGVAPGFITGRWLQQGLGTSYDQVKDSMAGATPLQRVCNPEDVAAAIVGLITGSDMVTGQTVVVDGGSLLGRGGLRR